MVSKLFSLEYEKALLGGVIQHPETFLEVSPFLRYSDFSRVNGTIWNIISQEVLNKGTPTPVILTQRLNSIGAKFEGIETLDYLENLRLSRIEKREVTGLAKEVKKLSMIRTVHDNAMALQQEVLRLKDGPIGNIVKAVDQMVSRSMVLFDSHDDEAVNLYERLGDFIERKGNNPTDEVGYKMPFQLWNDYYGGLRKGGLYFTASRSGQGKSTFLSYIGDSVANDCNPGKNIQVLFLDTEMDEDDQMARLAAARINCPFYLIDTGKWRQSAEWEPKIRAGIKNLKSQNRNLWFKQVSSMGIDDLVSFIKRWYYKNVGIDGNAFIVYDYLKVLANDNTNGQPEWQTALHKMQALKDLATDIQAPIFTALQVTRAGTTTNRSSDEMVDDESVLSISGRIDWLVNFGAILRRKTPDEISADGEDYGSHKLIPLKARYQGRISQGHHDLVRIMDKGKIRHKSNYICFDINNFKVEERGDFRRIAELRGWTKIKKNDNKDNGGGL